MLAQQLTAIQGQRARLATTSAQHEAVIRAATALLPHCGEAYQRGNDTLRRDYNQAWFDQIQVDSHDGHPQVTSVTRTELFEALHSAEIQSQTGTEIKQEPGVEANVFQQIRGSEPDDTGHHTEHGRFRARVLYRVSGSNVSCLVELLGCYSKRTSWTKCLRNLADLSLGDRSRAVRRLRRRVVTLSAAEIADLVDGYRSGTTVYELANRFKIHRTTVSQHLHRQHMPMRRPKQ